jgi:hypothetical protein
MRSRGWLIVAGLGAVLVVAIFGYQQGYRETMELMAAKQRPAEVRDSGGERALPPCPTGPDGRYTPPPTPLGPYKKVCEPPPDPYAR